MRDKSEVSQRSLPDNPCADAQSEPGLTRATPVHGVLIGILAAVDEAGQPSVSYAGNLAILPVPARATTAIKAESVGKEVALLFENGDITKPIVVGVLQEPTGSFEITKTEDNGTVDSVTSELMVDSRRIDLNASEQIVLKCGKSSITMTSAGKVIIRGAYVSSKSSGANRIKGGSVQIN